jgi:hypothetical protein
LALVAGALFQIQLNRKPARKTVRASTHESMNKALMLALLIAWDIFIVGLAIGFYLALE